MEINYCTKCGSKIDHITNYCLNCGISYDQTDRSRYVDVSGKSLKKGNTASFVFFSLMFIVLIGTIVYVSIKNNKDKQGIDETLDKVEISDYTSSEITKSNNAYSKPILIVSSAQVIYAGIKDDIYLTSNGPQYYVKGTVVNNGDVDAHNVKLIFRNSGSAGTLFLGPIKARQSKNFKSDYFDLNHHRAFDFDNENKNLSSYVDLSDPVFSCDELGGFPWER